jgi:hypothetical protein
MQKNRFPHFKKLLFVVGFILFSAGSSLAQAVYLPYSYQLDQKFNADIYSSKNSFHTALKPYLIDSTLSPKYNALMKLGIDSNRKSWVSRKLFNEHLFDVKTKEYTFYADYLSDLQVGRDITGKKNTNLNTRGYQLGGTVGSKFFFYSSGYENSGKFPAYFNNLINKLHFVPGQAYDRSFGVGDSKDWSYGTAIVSYTPIKQLNITLGEDKTFIGDGYRSLLLSDYAAPYPLLRLTANLGKVQYMVMWTYMGSDTIHKFDGFGSNRRKWGVFHYLDWNVNKRLSIGFFNALIAAEADNNGNLHGFDLNYINPVILSSSLGSSSPIPDNSFFGFTAKYKIFDKTAVYGQLMIDRFSAGSFLSGSNYASNTSGLQLGIRGADLFKVTNLNYLIEYNAVKPYTYGSTSQITNYTQYDEPLGDPLGANFREFIGMVNYSIGKFDFTGQVNYAKYGLDPIGLNFGKDVNQVFVPSIAKNSGIEQGIVTTLYYGEGTVSYLINPRYNLRLELGALLREEKNELGSQKATVFTFGLRSSFRNLYHDF